MPPPLAFSSSLSLCCRNRRRRCRLPVRQVLVLDRILGRAGECAVAVVGGSKVEDKIPMLKTLSRRVDCIAIGGNNVNAIVKNPALLDGVRGNRAEVGSLDPLQWSINPLQPARAPHENKRAAGGVAAWWPGSLSSGRSLRHL